MKAVIMAGGEGTRLRPLTCSKPKPMVPVANKPVMEHIIELLQKHGISDIAVTLQYMPQMIKEYFGDGKDKKVNIRYFVEEEPLGTAGSVKNAEDFLDETFIVISGDALTDVDIDKAVEFHKNKGSVATLVLKKVDIPLEYGVVVTDDDGRITRFLEKPGWSEVFSDTVNTGIYILSPEIFSYFQKGVFYDFSKDLFPELLKDGKALYGYITENYWCDIGDLKAYNQANIDAVTRKAAVNISYKEIKPGIYAGENVKISDSAVLVPPVVIGNNCIIGDNSRVGPECVIGDFCVAEPFSSIKKSVILKNSYISRNCEVRGAVLCDRVKLHEGVRVFENAVIGEYTCVNRYASIMSDIKIWPEKLIEDETVVNSNIVWGSRFKKSIFGNRGISGEFNIEISPEFSAKVAASFAVSILNGKKAGIACDGEKASIMIKASMAAGFLSVGTDTVDFGNTILSAARNYIKSKELGGGIYISTASEGSCEININFLDESGLDIGKQTERKIENIYLREDFRRSTACEVGILSYADSEAETYIDNILKLLENKNIGAKIAYYIQNNSAEDILQQVLKRTGCRSRRLKLSDSADSEELLEQIREAVITQKFDAGVIFDARFEELIIVDNKGNVHRGESLRLLKASALLASRELDTIVVPYNSTQLIDDLADKINKKVLRSRTSSQDLMRTIAGLSDSSRELQLAVNFDAVFALCFLLLTVKNMGMNLYEFAEQHPPIKRKRQEVFCPWNVKGRVIRELIHEKNALKDCNEGVMLTYPKGRVLILPDAERPVCNIISEAATAELAEELSILYSEKVKQIGKN